MRYLLVVEVESLGPQRLVTLPEGVTLDSLLDQIGQTPAPSPIPSPDAGASTLLKRQQIEEIGNRYGFPVEPSDVELYLNGNEDWEFIEAIMARKNDGIRL